MDIREYFRKLRFDQYHHLGLGDIRITIGQQDEIIAAFEELEIESEENKSYLIHQLEEEVSNLKRIIRELEEEES